MGQYGSPWEKEEGNEKKASHAHGGTSSSVIRWRKTTRKTSLEDSTKEKVKLLGPGVWALEAMREEQVSRTEHLMVVRKEQGKRWLRNACCTSSTQVIRSFNKRCFME